MAHELAVLEVSVAGEPHRDSTDGTQPVALTPSQLQLRGMVLDSVTSPHSRRNYRKALDLLFAFAAGRPLSRALMMEYRASMDALAPSTVNVRLAAVRKLVHEARKNGMLSAEEAASLTEVPNVRQQGTRLGNWLTRTGARAASRPGPQHPQGQARLRQPRSPGRLRAAKKGTGLAHRRGHPAAGEPLGHPDLRVKGGRVRTVAVPMWVKQGINAWQTAAGIEEGPLLRSITKGGKIGDSLETGPSGPSSPPRRRRSASSVSAPTTSAAPARSSAARPAATSSRSSSCSGTRPSRRRSVTLGPSRISPSRSMTAWAYSCFYSHAESQSQYWRNPNS